MMNNIKISAPAISEIFRSPRPQDAYCFSPGICVLPSGRIIVTMDVGGKGAVNLESAVKNPNGGFGRIFTSDDEGKSWQLRADILAVQERPFTAGGVLYVLGHTDDGPDGNRDLALYKSTDDGVSWDGPFMLTEGERWHQAPANVVYANGCVYLVMERDIYNDCEGWNVSVLGPVLMRARVGDDLSKRENWTFSDTVAFRDIVNSDSINYFGIPFYETPPKSPFVLSEKPRKRTCAPIGWLETNVVQFLSPEHIWNDPTGHTFHLFMRAHTGCTGYAAIMKAVERDDGGISLMTETLPSGKPIVYLPFPGGQMKFHILYDEVSELYWLLSTQATDSMIRPEFMSRKRYGLPDNERRRLTLHFSKNCVDWCFAALIDTAESDQVMARSYGAMAICGDNLYFVTRSGDENASSSHNTNLVLFHILRNFRGYIY